MHRLIQSHYHLFVGINASKLPLDIKKMRANLLFLMPPDVEPLEVSELCFPYVWNAYGFYVPLSW